MLKPTLAFFLPPLSSLSLSYPPLAPSCGRSFRSCAATTTSSGPSAPRASPAAPARSASKRTRLAARRTSPARPLHVPCTPPACLRVSTCPLRPAAGLRLLSAARPMQHVPCRMPPAARPLPRIFPVWHGPCAGAAVAHEGRRRYARKKQRTFSSGCG